MKALIKIAPLIIAACVCAPTGLLAKPVATQKDVAYKARSASNVLDLYYPAEGEGPYPTHIYLHGGGWTGGSKSLGGTQAQVFEKLSDAGFLGISVEYRLVQADQNRYMRTCVVDCMDAIRYVFNHAEELKVDPTNVFVWGGSAGGHLSLLCATAPESTFPGDVAAENPVQFRAVAAFYPPTDMLNYEAISVEFNHKLRDLSRRIGRKVETDPVAFIEISPLAHLTKEDPPVLMLHGDQDAVVNIEHAYRFQQKAETLGVDSELIVIENADHGFSSANGQAIQPDIDFIINATAQFFIDQIAE